MGVRLGYPNPKMEMKIKFSSLLNINRVTNKYMKIKDRDGEGKICLYPV